jgi:hypothetical protein
VYFLYFSLSLSTKAIYVYLFIPSLCHCMFSINILFWLISFTFICCNNSLSVANIKGWRRWQRYKICRRFNNLKRVLLGTRVQGTCGRVVGKCFELRKLYEVGNRKKEVKIFTRSKWYYKFLMLVQLEVRALH